MTTSGSFDYSATAADIVTSALEDVQAYEAGETADTNDVTMCLRTLNFLVKQWQGTSDMARGLKVWTRQRIYLWLRQNKVRYTIGPAATDDFTALLFGRTTISSNEAAGQTIISITSNTDSLSFPGTTSTMANTNIVGIELDSGDIYWTTISGTPAATMTIAVALPSASSQGNFVWWFAAAGRAQRVVDVENALLRDSDNNDTDLEVYTEVQRYERIPDKLQTGDPMRMLVEPGRLNTAVTFDVAPTDVSKIIRVTALYPAEDYDATTDDIAFPQEWLAALEWELARRIAPKLGKQWTAGMEANWTTATAFARELNPDVSSMHFEPERQR